MFFQELIGIPPILDFEASSLSDESFPVSAGLVINGRSHYWLIQPKTTWTDWSLSSQAVHGLERKYIVTNGGPAEEVHDEICELISKEEAIYSDAPEWERHWFLALGVPPKIKGIQDALSPDKSGKFQETKASMFKVHDLIPHRADHDALAIALAARYLSIM